MTEQDQAVAAAGLLDRLAAKRSLTRAELEQAAKAADAVAGYARDLGVSLGKVNDGRNAVECAELAKRAAGIAQRAGVLLARFGGAGDAGVNPRDAGLPNPLQVKGFSPRPGSTESHQSSDADLASGTGFDLAAVRAAYADESRRNEP